ncbi:MAG: nuclear transport factor 2 family protein [Actinomycetota bacterium]
MSQENVEFVLRRFEEFEADGGPNPESWHEDGVLTAPDGWPEPGPFKGRAAIMRQFERLVGDFSDFHSTNVEVIAEADDWVVIAFRWHTRGAQSGIAGTWEMTAAFRLKDGRFIEAHYRWERQEALEAAGLRE